MYKQNFKRDLKRRPFHKGLPSRNGRRFHAGHRIKSKGIDISKFVNKAVEAEASAPFTPEHLFKDFNIKEDIKKNILAKGYESPTPIQDKIIPHILNGSDVVGIANTGTGKTGAFLIPLINKVLMDHKENVLIVAPTRELAIQINQEFKDFSRYLKIFSVCCVGGAHIGRQISELKRPHRFIIGTPGRIKDLNKRKLIDFSRFNTVVLDEADRMLDMGFIEDMRFMMSRLPKERQTLFFSATLSKEIEKLIAEFLNNPITVSVKTRDTASNVEQDIIKIKHGEDKIEVLYNLLSKPEFNKVIIFGKTKHGVEKLYATLAKKGLRVESIHGDKNHSKRQRALGLFKDNRAKILVATDVAARGLDIDNVSHVINFDIPATYEDYVHRIGRTGRGNKKGKALTFVN
ncbi:MAG: DEAD/DEAH box helicase [Parcubacteria group bacterium]|nr:DEAD/DEAH box helicase [Parcubacteria group bacterium]MCR4342723.1 DEAD/DEAH box helicase [Patescibacteria group bacterium]